MSDNNRISILMADDDEDDCMLTSEAFLESGVTATFSHVKDGIELMHYLFERSSVASKLPDLLLLDLNMPRKDGREALIQIRSEPALQNIPIVILTTSKEEKDVAFSMKAGAKAFITKPATFHEWVEIMKSLAENWLNACGSS